MVGLLIFMPYIQGVLHSSLGPENSLYIIYLLLTAIGLMPGGNVYKDHSFNKETAHLTNTAQDIARIFTVQYSTYT
jgi:hypothetical protein